MRYGIQLCGIVLNSVQTSRMSSGPGTNDPRLSLADRILDAYTVLSVHLSEAETDESHGQVPAISYDRW